MWKKKEVSNFIGQILNGFLCVHDGEQWDRQRWELLYVTAGSIEITWADARNQHNNRGTAHIHSEVIGVMGDGSGVQDLIKSLIHF